MNGFGEDYALWSKKNKPKEPMYHVYNSQRSRHDLCLLAAPAIYLNRLSSLEYMDETIRLPKKNKNILMRNLFVVLSCGEIVALTRLLAIKYLSVCLLLHWLAANTLELAEHNWGPVSMGLALDVFIDKLKEVIANPRLVLQKSFMMNIFAKFLTDLPPVKAY